MANAGYGCTSITETPGEVPMIVRTENARPGKGNR